MHHLTSKIRTSETVSADLFSVQATGAADLIDVCIIGIFQSADVTQMLSAEKC